MLRISGDDGLTDAALLRVEGRIGDRWVPELADACERILHRGRRLILDLGGTTFVDGPGVDLLRGLSEREVTLVNCSPFVAEQVKAARR